MGSKVKIGIMLEQMPEEVRPEYRHRPLVDRVRDAIELVQSGHDSRDEWNFLRRLNNCLVRRAQANELSSEGEVLLRMIEPIIAKYGMNDPRGVRQDVEVGRGAVKMG